MPKHMRRVTRRPSEDEIKRFNRHVFKTAKCWLWSAGVSSKGYGHFFVEGKQMPAHRVAWAIEHGADAGDLMVCHKCDIPSCVRPDHLFLGTNADNIRDMWAKGRRKEPIGEASLNAKLTENEVREIRALRPQGVTAGDIAKRFGICYSHVYDIWNRVAWGNVA